MVENPPWLRPRALPHPLDLPCEPIRGDAAAFEAWCARYGFRSLPASPEAVAGFLVAEAEAGRAASTIGRRLAAIKYAHKLVRQPDPTEDEAVRATMKGIRRKVGTAPDQKAAATADVLMAMLMRTPDTLTGKRDRALLALGFAGAFRRSELVALDVSDLREDPEGLRVLVRRSKVDQEGAGFEKATPHGRFIRPVALLRDWLETAGITEGPIFRPVSRSGRVRMTMRGTNPACLTTQAVADIVKRYATAAGSMPRPSGLTPCGPATSRQQRSAARTLPASWTSLATEIRVQWFHIFAA